MTLSAQRASTVFLSQYNSSQMSSLTVNFKYGFKQLQNIITISVSKNNIPPFLRILFHTELPFPCFTIFLANCVMVLEILHVRFLTYSVSLSFNFIHKAVKVFIEIALPSFHGILLAGCVVVVLI